MKGSAFKLGNVATKSALKQVSPMKTVGRRPEHKDKHPHEGTKDVQKGPNDWGVQSGTWTDENTFVPTKGDDQEDYNVKDEYGIWSREEEMEGGLPMKSALKHTESIERGKSATHEDHHEGRADIKRPPGGDSPVPMKSPLEHKDERDGKYIMVDGKKTKQTHSHWKDGKKMTEEEVNKANVRKKSMKSPLEQKLNENPHARVQDRYRGKEKGRYDYGTDPRTGEELKGFRNDPWDPIKGVIRPNEEQWYEDNPNMSPTADEQDIFAGRDIQATRAQYRKNPDTGYRYTQAKTRGGSIDPNRTVSMRDDMGTTGVNDVAYVNRGMRLEREKRKSKGRKGEMNWDTK